MKVLITRPRTQADDFAERLRVAGFESIFFPVIEIRPIENNAELAKAVENIQRYDWVVFTSVNAVNIAALSGALAQSKRGDVQRVKIAAIGPKTAEALRKQEIEPDFIPEEYVGEAIMSGFGDVNGKWILLLRAEIAREVLPKAIVEAGGIAHEIVVYRTLPAKADSDGLNALKSGVDVVTFTSASTVENFVAITRQHGLDPLNLPNNPLFACIGPVTAQAAKEEGITDLIIAEEYTTDGLIQALRNSGVHHA